VVLIILVVVVLVVTASLLLFREAHLVAELTLREKLHKQVVCYATSVIHEDWPAMGHDRLSSVPTYWGALIRSELIPLVGTRRQSIARRSHSHSS
jgi:hypothetical protein